MAFVVGFLVLFFAALWGFISSSLLIKTSKVAAVLNPGTLGYNYEFFRTVTDDTITIEGWFVPAKVKSKSTIVILHGWGANKSDIAPSTIFLAHRYNLVYFDFRNHGESGGKETSLTTLEIKDFKAVVKFIKTEKSDFSRSVAVYGFSMGAVVAISGSAEMSDIKAVIAESPFSSYNETVARFGKLFYGVPRALFPITTLFVRMRLGFDPEAGSPILHISKISPRPLLIIQAGNDLRMPVSEGEALYKTAKEPKELWIVPGADHGGVQQQVPEEYKKKLLNFFEKWMKG